MDSIPIPMPSATSLDYGTVVTLALFIILFLLISALLAGAEVAFFSLDSNEKQQLKSDESKAAKLVLELLLIPKELLATILILNTFVNFGVVVLSSVLFHVLFPELQFTTINFAIEICIITFLLVLLSEVIPKNYAHQNGVVYVTRTVFILAFLSNTPPISWIKKMLVKGTRFVNKYADASLNDVSSNELEQAINLTIEDGVSEDDQMILEGIIQLGNKDVAQIMCSIEKMVYISSSDSFSKIMSCIMDSGYSRIPVVANDSLQVIGILYSKDLLKFTDAPYDFDWLSLIREPFFTIASTKIDDLLKSFQELKKHIAIVVDENQRTIGIVTLEDVIEEIVGDITEEFDDVEMDCIQLNTNEYLVNTAMTVEAVGKALAIPNSTLQAKSVLQMSMAEYFQNKLGREMRSNESVPFFGYKCSVEEIEAGKLKKIRIVKE